MLHTYSNLDTKGKLPSRVDALIVRWVCPPWLAELASSLRWVRKHLRCNFTRVVSLRITQSGNQKKKKPIKSLETIYWYYPGACSHYRLLCWAGDSDSVEPSSSKCHIHLTFKVYLAHSLRTSRGASTPIKHSSLGNLCYHAFTQIVITYHTPNTTLIYSF